jgi:inositol-hexakisphosphate/diphosphoinositol-pentakisphosphate 1-kinase
VRSSAVSDGAAGLIGNTFSFVTHLNDAEKSWATKICEGFGQRVCGFDVLRCDNGRRSMVIDVNGWSFVKGNESYYGKLNVYP